MFIVKRNGNIVNQVIFVGEQKKDLYRSRNVVPLTFATKKAANEVLSVWPEATIEEVA